MVLHLEEYSLKNDSYGKLLSYYDKLPQFIHEMSAEEILKEISRNGTKTFYQQKAAIANYLLWLNNTYGIDVNDLYFALSKNDNKKSFKYKDF